MTITGSNYIAGRASRAGQRDASRAFTSVDPRTRTPGDVTFVDATPEEVDRAVRAAAAAFAETRLYPASKLADFLDHAADAIEALGEDLLTTADRETGLGFPRLTGERGRTTSQLRAFGRLLREGAYVEAIIDTAQPDRQPAPRPTIRRMLVPLGPVGVFSASNFPFAFAVAGGDTASAFAAGCPVIVKGHPGHPATSELFALALNRAVAESGFPAGFFSLLQGQGHEVGGMLVRHPDLAAVGFTGSLRGGRALYDLAAARPTPIPVYAEMGSINPVVILPGAIRARGESLAEGLVNSVTLGSGQFCTNPGLVLIQDSPETAAFITDVKDRMDHRDVGVLLNAAVEQGLAATTAETLRRESVERLTADTAPESHGFCFANTVMQTTGEAFRADPALQTEHFGPVTLFVVCRSQGDLQASIDVLEGNLTATIHAEDDEIAAAGSLYSQLREKVGRLIWNGFPTGVEVVHSMQHGGPYPATTAPWSTSVGLTAIKRFMRPVAYQNLPDALLPDALKDANPLGIWRLVDDELTRDPVG